MKKRFVCLFAIVATLGVTLFYSNSAFAMFGLKPTDNPYFCRVNASGWQTTSPQHIKDVNNTGNVWAESEVDGHTLKSRYYFTSGFGDNIENEWISFGNAEYMQQYVATDSTQSITFSWDGSLSLSGPESGEYWIEYSLTLDVGIWDPDKGDWRSPLSWDWPTEYSFTEDHQTIEDTTDSVSVNTSKTETFHFAPGTRFLTWVSLGTTGGVSTSSQDNSAIATGDADFYNTFTLDNVSGADEAPVPEPATILLCCFGFVMAGMRKKG